MGNDKKKIGRQSQKGRRIADDMRFCLLPFICALLIALCVFGAVGYAAGPAAGSGKKVQLDMKTLPPGIAKQIEKSGWAGVIVVLDDSDTRGFAARQRRALGVRFDNPAIQAGRVHLLNQKKDKVTSRIGPQDYSVIRNYAHFPVLFLKVNAHALALLQRMREVKSVNENRVLTPFYTDNQTLIGLPDAWTYGSTTQEGLGTSVAVLDTGIDYLSGIIECVTPGDPGCIAQEECFATPNGEGGTPDCTTNKDHGTNVSGIVFQVAPEAEVVALDIFLNGVGYESDILTALDWVIDNQSSYNIVAVNMSLGGSLGYTSPCPGDALAPAISNLRSAGIASAVAAGNMGWASQLSAPGCAPDAVSVGAVYANDYGLKSWSTCSDSTTAADQVVCFSNSASFLSLLAPGSVITAAGVTMSGTSQATPHVAGAVAVLKSQDGSLTVDEEVARLQVTGVPITDDKNGIIKPRIDLLSAVSVTDPSLVTGPASFDFKAPGLVNPDSQTLKIINGGTGTMDWSVSWAEDNGGPGWLVLPAAPPVTGTGSQDVPVGIDTTGLSPGTYTGELTVTATDGLSYPASGSPVTIPVTLDVLDPAYGDDFETGDLTKFPWVTGGTGGSWAPVSGTGHNSTYAAQSPAMSDSQSSYLGVTLNVTSSGYVYFWLKTDTEELYDNLKFYVDGVNEGTAYGWSGTNDWTLAQSEHEVGPGLHTFEWIYAKDSDTSVGADTVWLDDVFFPPVNLVTVSPESHDFGELAVGNTSLPETFTVSNMGGSGVTLGSLSISGADAAEFSIVGGNDNCTGQTLGASGSCTVDVTFNPVTQADGKSALLSIPVGGSSAVTIASLSGTGGVKHQLTIVKNNAVGATGTGVVSSTPDGIDCGSLCSARFFDGDTVDLTAVADPGSEFSGWTGEGCSGTGTCSFSITSDATVYADFATIPPTADFSAFPLSGAAPLEVTFTDASSTNTDSWSWRFGDNVGQAWVQNPVYTYTNPGTYSVSLTVANPGGSNTKTITDYIDVTCPLSPNDVRIPRDTSLYYSTVQSAFTDAFTYGDTVQIHDGVTIVDTPILDNFKTVTLRGGYDPCFTGNAGLSTIQGSLTIKNGTLTVDRIVIQDAP